jgi:oligoendopeptidase F
MAWSKALAAIAALLVVAATVRAEEVKMATTTRERSQIDEAYKWKVEDLYASQADWDKDLVRLEADLKAMASCKGKLGKSAKQLAGCLELQFALHKRFARLHNYAGRVHHQDAADVKGQELHERMSKLGTRVDAELSWLEPEILAIAPGKYKALIKTKALSTYRHYLDNITRRRAHVLGPAEEKIIARAGDLTALPYKAYETLSTLNLPFAEITLKDGQKVQLTQAMYTRFRATPDRPDRVRVFEAFFGTYKKFRETYAGLLAGVVSADRYRALVRGYPTDLAAALDRTNVPTSIYTNMIEQIKASRPLLWRYLKLRKKLLGLDTLGYPDLYTSLVPAVDIQYDWKAAQDLLLAALAPMGEDYLAIMRKAFSDRWTDVYPNRGKRSGAYMSGSAYDVHPYVLLNYNDDYESVSTTAHEFGHAAHSYLSNKHQPFHDADYPIFTAEVASTANENLLRLHVTDREKDPAKKLFLLGGYLENWRQTVFRQCLFAEFELKIHEAAAAGTPLTADFLDETYLALLREWYGEAEGVTQIDPLYAVEWAYIPHFFYNFYMFQYTTSFIASTAIAEKIYQGDTKARADYLSMLQAGGSKYPVDLLKMAGVDMTSAQPYRTAFKALEQALAEVEQLVK